MNQVMPSGSHRQLRIAAAVSAAIAGILATAYFLFLRPNYQVLAKGMRPEQAAAVVEELKKEKVSYELRDGGSTILVPSSELDHARLDVEAGDLPLKGSVGFELFNQSDMGLTDFAQKVNYQRALQGEIARTIMSMDGIAAARVHIALPERSLFRTTRSEPRAAVTLTPDPAVDIDAGRIAGIQRLVAATVPDLAIDQVAILNERGQLLTPEFSDVPGAASSESAIEEDYRERIARVVADAVPRAHVQIKVTVVPHSGGLSDGAAGARSSTSQGRDHSIRVVLFDRSGLTPRDEQTIRNAVTGELSMEPSLGDAILFSPAPEVASSAPGDVRSPMAPIATAETPAATPNDLMERISRGWTMAVWLSAALVLLVGALRIRRGRHYRRQQLVARIREQLLPVEGAANAA